MPLRSPSFRPGNVLATRFTGTLSERSGTPVERIGTPDRLVSWLTVNGLEVPMCTVDALAVAHELRESIHAAATATAVGDALPAAAIGVINARSAEGSAVSVLTDEGTLDWRLTDTSSLRDALGVVAADAISLLAGERDGRLALCASPTCRAVFLDSSQSRTRRWCDMNTCGNRQKKARFEAAHQTRATPDPPG